MWAGATPWLAGILLQAGPPPLTLDQAQAVYGFLAVLLVARLLAGPLVYLHARRRTGRDSWWATAALLSPLIGGILYAVLGRPRDPAGSSSWNPWVPCPSCGAPRGWSPDPCPRCGALLPAAPGAPAAPRPGYPVPPPGYAPPPPPAPLPAPAPAPAPARAAPTVEPAPPPPPRPGFAPSPPSARKRTDVTGAQVLGALVFVVLLTNVVATLALIPSLMAGMTEADLVDLQFSPVFVLLALVLQDSILLAVTVDQSLFQGRLDRRKMGLGWSKTGHFLPWHIAVGLGAGLVTFAFSAVAVDFMLQVFSSLGVDTTSASVGTPDILSLGDYLLFIPSFVVIAPVAEEMFFRGYALGGFANRGQINTGLVFTSVLFGAIHLNPLTFLPLAMAGMVLGTVYLRTGSLVAPLVAHATNNFTALTLAYMGY